ncbi:uncharacterized protein PG998_003926 [Apiospora kogelbergensis]|uniref:Uncharacterized protein n=1 Tax=Apiospora kogelbergensis TaxID=1337665 RepID=A0AAW0QM43_9PEZI
MHPVAQDEEQHEGEVGRYEKQFCGNLDTPPGALGNILGHVLGRLHQPGYRKLADGDPALIRLPVLVMIEKALAMRIPYGDLTPQIDEGRNGGGRGDCRNNFLMHFPADQKR